MSYTRMSVVAGEAITAGQMCELDASGYAVATAVNSAKFAGVALNTITTAEASAGKKVTLVRGDVVPLVSAAAIAPGARVVVDDSVATKILTFNGASHTAAMIIGYAAEAASGADETIDVVLF